MARPLCFWAQILQFLADWYPQLGNTSHKIKLEYNNPIFCGFAFPIEKVSSKTYYHYKLYQLNMLTALVSLVAVPVAVTALFRRRHKASSSSTTCSFAVPARAPASSASTAARSAFVRVPRAELPVLANDRLLRVVRRQAVDRAPVWVMRQAGRYERTLFFSPWCRLPACPRVHIRGPVAVSNDRWATGIACLPVGLKFKLKVLKLYDIIVDM